MFILYAVVAGLVLGLLSGGRPAALADLRLRWAPAIAIGMAVQLALFSSPLGDAAGDAAPWIYAASNVLVLGAVAVNLAIPGLPLVLLGGLANAVAIIANGGYMPVSADALQAMGRSEASVYSNSRLLAEPVLGPLTDIFAMPTWLPTANVFSLGDVLIGVGIAMAIALGMHGRGPRVTNRHGVAPAGGAAAH